MPQHECQQCGKCCHQLSPTLTEADVNREPRLWDYAVPIERVVNPATKQYMAEKKHPFALRKRHRGGPCVFLANNLCVIHSTRPQICRDYPQGAQCLRSDQ